MHKTGEILQARQRAILGVIENNPLLFGRYYFPNHFRSKSAPFQMKIVKEATLNRWIAVQAPRESSKSTILTFLMTIHSIIFKKSRFIVIVQNTFEKAADSLDTVKSEIKSNEKLNGDFKITIRKDAQGDTIFKMGDFETRVLCKGADQIGSLRGVKFGAYRPDLIIGDDLEDDEMVRNPERRRDFRNLFDEALIPCGDRETCRYIFVGTILHDDCQMAKLVSPDFYKEYRKLFYRARYQNSRGELCSLWPEKWTVEVLNQMERDKPSVFAKEYQGDPASLSGTKFLREDFRYWREEGDSYVLLNENGEVVSKGELRNCKPAIGCDLAWEEKKTSDFTAIVPIFFTPKSDVLVGDYVCKIGMRPDAMEEYLFTMEAKMRATTKSSVPIGMEKAKIEKIMKYLLKQAMRRRNHYLWFKDVVWDTDKIARIVTRLQPRYSQHVMYHKQGMGELENQILRIPSGTHDDLPDALQMAVQLVDIPKSLKTPRKVEDEGFAWLQKLTKAKKERNRFVFGKKPSQIPATVSWR